MNHRRALSMLLALLLVLTVAPAGAQDAAPGTGDAWIDGRLADIDRYARAYPEPFVDELVRYHGAPRDFVLDRLQQGWTAGELYYACAVATALGRSCRQVADLRSRQSAADWNALAAELGLKPGSAQAQRLRAGIVASYARWGRPLPREATTTDPAPARGARPDPPPASGPAPSKRR